MSTSFPRYRWLMAALLALVAAIYGAHLNNQFHFDDAHAVVQNPYIRDLHNLPRFFENGDMSSVLPANRAYRPVVQASLAIDYRLGRGLAPFWFHFSTLLWFLAQVWLVFVLSQKLFDAVSPGSSNALASIFAAALFGLHPVMAETVNYVIQRAEVQSTLGVVAGLTIYVCFPRLRSFGVYLLPVALGVLAKPPAMIFPALLFLYLLWIEEEAPRVALLRVLPSLAVVLALGFLVARMTPAQFIPGAFSPWHYRMTQPLVALRYFSKFFIPTGLTADTDHAALESFLDDGVIQGFLFLAALLAAIFWTSRRRELRPAAFGLAWFLIALLPTSLMALAEVENDHRMYFPFVGLAIAAAWTFALAVRRGALSVRFAVSGAVLLLAVFSYASWVRCETWKTEESLWRDVTIKSPYNGRGLMNYGLSLMARGDYPGAAGYFERAATFLPNYYVLEINRGIVNGALKDPARAEAHFQRAIALAPDDASARFYYARWLHESGRYAQAAALLRASIAQNPSLLDSYYLLMQNQFDAGDAAGVRAAAQQMLARFPQDATARNWLERAGAVAPATPETWLNQSLALYQQGKYPDCIQAARKALELRPGYALAWNNITAAYNSMGNWDEAIKAGQMAVKLDPNSQLAKNNLAWALTNKARAKK